MLVDKWELLKAYIDGLHASSTGVTQKMIGKIITRMDTLEMKEKEERERLVGLPIKETPEESEQA